jgi:microtubule-associated protein-like 6
MEVISQINGFHKSTVGHLSFSPNGSCLLSIGNDKDNSIAIYDWASKALICATRTGTSRVVGLDWKNDTEFATVDSNNVIFYKLDGKNLSSKKGIMGKKVKGAGRHTCCAFTFT